MNRALKLDPDLDISHARQIVDTRNWVIHGYDKVDDVGIWAIISKHLPELRKKLINISKRINACCFNSFFPNDNIRS